MADPNPPNPHAYQTFGKQYTGPYSRAYLVEYGNDAAVCRLFNLEGHTRNRVEAFERGARIMCELDHPNIIRAHSSFTDPQLDLWTVLPYIPSGSVRTIMSNYFEQGFTEEYIAVILKQVLKALDFLHQQSLPHKGVKASNIFFNHGYVKLSDFGTSSASYNEFNTILSGLYWRAPEMTMNHDKEFTIQTDIWAFGITALELARGILPLPLNLPCNSFLSNLAARFRFSEYRENNSLFSLLSGPFVQMLTSCLDPLPSKRPTAADLLNNDFFSNPNLPTLDEIISGINQVIMATGGVYYPLSPVAPPVAVAEKKSQSTVDAGTSHPEIVPTSVTDTFTQLLLAPTSDDELHPSSDGTPPTKMIGSETSQGVSCPSSSAPVAAVKSQTTPTETSQAPKGESHTNSPQQIEKPQGKLHPSPVAEDKSQTTTLVGTGTSQTSQAESSQLVLAETSEASSSSAETTQLVGSEISTGVSSSTSPVPAAADESQAMNISILSDISEGVSDPSSPASVSANKSQASEDKCKWCLPFSHCFNFGAK